MTRVRPYSIQEIVDAVADYYHVTDDDIIGYDRFSHLTEPRQLCYLLLHDTAGFSWPSIARNFSRTHGTILSGSKHLRARIAADPIVAQRRAEVEARLCG